MGTLIFLTLMVVFVTSLIIASVIYIPMALIYACDASFAAFLEILLLVIFSPLIVIVLLLYFIIILLLDAVSWLGEKFIH